MTGGGSVNSEIIYYKVIRDPETDYFKYIKSENSNIEDSSKWQNALRLRQRCDDAVFRTSKLLIQLKGSRQEEYRERRRGYIDEIEIFACSGLEHGDLEGANADLDTFERQFVDFEGPSVRQRFLFKTLHFAFVLGLLSLAIGLMIDPIAPLFSQGTPVPILHSIAVVPKEAFSAIMFILVGNCLGVVFSAFTRNLNMNFQNLGNFDAAGLKPSLRFVFVAILSSVVAVFLQQKLFKICFGGAYCLDESFVLSGVDPMKCIVIGIICGLADVLVTRILTDTVGEASNKARTK